MPTHVARENIIGVSYQKSNGRKNLLKRVSVAFHGTEPFTEDGMKKESI